MLKREGKKVISKILNLFKKNENTGAKSGKSKVSVNSDIKDIISFVDYVVRALVDEPGAVKIELSETDTNEKVININCKKADIGKIIGKNGKTIMAIRSLVTGAASRLNEQISVEVIDQVES